MTDWLEVAKTAAGPFAGVASGLMGSLLGLKKRMEKVEARVTRHHTTLQGHAALFESIESDFEKLREELSEYQDKQTEFSNRMRETSSDFAKDAELGNFMSEQQERWRLIERTLGHIEGYLGIGPQPSHHTPRPHPRSPPQLPQTQIIQVNPNLQRRKQ